MLKELNQYKEFRNLVTLFAVILAGFMQAAIIQIFMRPLNLLSSGFTGVAILIEKITSTFFWIYIFNIIRYVGFEYSSCFIL